MHRLAHCLSVDLRSWNAKNEGDDAAAISRDRWRGKTVDDDKYLFVFMSK
jgi:hypothetical protein